MINNLRKNIPKKRKLEELNHISLQSKVCKNCYQLSNRLKIISRSQADNDPDTSGFLIYRQSINYNYHSWCTFGYKNHLKLISIPRIIRCKLFMNYKFLEDDDRICSNHVDNYTFWPLVKQITKEISAKEQKNNQWSYVYLLSRAKKKWKDIRCG